MCCTVCIMIVKSSFYVSHSQFQKQNVPHDILFSIWNQYSAIARKRSNTAAAVKYKSIDFLKAC